MITLVDLRSNLRDPVSLFLVADRELGEQPVQGINQRVLQEFVSGRAQRCEERRHRSGLANQSERRCSLAADRQLVLKHQLHQVIDGVRQPRGQLGGGRVGPGELQTARVRRHDPVDFAHAVDRAVDLRLADLGCGTPHGQPSTGVDHEQTAIGVFQHIGWMKVDARRTEKDLVRSAPSRTLSL